MNNWKNSSAYLPEDDQNVLCINKDLPMEAIKAYYDKEFDAFISLESINLTPLKITHWMPFPQFIKEKAND